MIVFDEKKLAEHILATGRTPLKTYATLSLLARYLRLQDESTATIKQQLAVFASHLLGRKYTDNIGYWIKAIDSICKKERCGQLFKCDGVGISQTEIDRVKSIKGEQEQRLAFALLCYAKYNNIRNPQNSNWVYQDIKEIFTSARIAIPSDARYSMLNSLLRQGVIKTSPKITNLHIQVLIADNGEPVYAVPEFSELGYEWRRLCGQGRFARCKKCGKLFRQNKKNNRKYCKACADRHREQTKRIECVGCGKWMFVSTNNTKTTLCEDCINSRKQHPLKD